jgi:hypothetical protein
MGPPRDLRNIASHYPIKKLAAGTSHSLPPEEIMLSIIMLVSNKQAS